MTMQSRITHYLIWRIMCSQVKKISDPLVWRHRWCNERKKVIHQYKFCLSDEATFERDEWGPWVHTEVTTNDQVTGQVVTQTVCRSDPLGVDLVRSYPKIDDFPGMEEWLDLDTWKAELVFDHLQKWYFHQNSEQALKSWNELHSWHTSHQSSNDDIMLGEPMRLASSSFSTTPLSWSEMWEIIFKDVQEDQESQKGACNGGKVKGDSNSLKQQAHKEHFLDPTSKRVDRESLSKSTNAVELNRVTNPNYTTKQQRVEIAMDESNGAAYLSKHIDSKGALFFIKLKHFEGEFAVGLGRRTFNEEVDCLDDEQVEVEWFERKSKKQDWGMKPAFQLSVAAYEKGRRKIYAKSVESLVDFIPIVVAVTKATLGTDNPVLSQNTMDALRSKMTKTSASESKSELKGNSALNAQKRKEAKGERCKKHNQRKSSSESELSSSVDESEGSSIEDVEHNTNSESDSSVIIDNEVLNVKPDTRMKRLRKY